VINKCLKTSQRGLCAIAKREVEIPVTEGSGNVSANLGLVDQPKVSALMKGRLANFSSERLMCLLDALG
jgi:hypothetical protein